MFGVLWQRFDEGGVLEVRIEVVPILPVLTLAAIILLCLIAEILYEDTVSCSALIDQAVFDYKSNC